VALIGTMIVLLALHEHTSLATTCEDGGTGGEPGEIITFVIEVVVKVLAAVPWVPATPGTDVMSLSRIVIQRASCIA
jgi:hypothetical protein